MLLAIALAAAAAAQDAWLDKPVDDATFQTYLEFFEVDSELPLDVEVSETDVTEGVKREHLTYVSSRGERVTSLFFSAATDEGQRRPAIIALHGGGRRGKRYSRQFAPTFVRAGWDVLAIDMKHFGERDTGLMTTFNEQDKHDALYNAKPVYLEWVVQTVKDVSRAYDLLADERNIDPDRIALFGFSRGAVAGFIAAGAEPRLAGYISVSGGHFDALEREHTAAACPANYVSRISPRPLLMLNGDHDTDFVKETSVQPMFDLAREPKTLRWEDRGHGFLRDDEWLFLLDWLRENVK